MEYRFILNRRSNVLHKLPASESCNTDQIARELRIKGMDENPVTVQTVQTAVDSRLCKRCFSDVR